MRILRLGDRKEKPAWVRALNWWRRRESNPRPQIVPLSVYMLSRCIIFALEDFLRQNSPGLAYIQF